MNRRNVRQNWTIEYQKGYFYYILRGFRMAIIQNEVIRRSRYKRQLIMPSIAEYHTALSKLEDWDTYLKAESRLPGARSNLELLYACADLAPREKIMGWLALSPQDAPENTPHCFLACCGVISLGRLLCEGDLSWLGVLRERASDPRWRVRESVCMALQRFGLQDMPTLLDEMDVWAAGSPYEQRAAAAALCEPALLKNANHASRVLQLLNRITTSMTQTTDRKRDDHLTLRQALAYCWSVATVALPEEGKPLMESWLKTTDKDIRWVMKENLKKNRLMKMDAEWTRRCAALTG
jgi:hypothetical protein